MVAGIRDEDREWLEPDGLGGFASGTAAGVRTRRYHALLLAAATPPTGRVALVNGLDAWLSTGTGHHALSTQRYADGTVEPDGHLRIARFRADPWPTWVFRTHDGAEVVHEILVAREPAETILRWRLLQGRAPAHLTVRLLVSGRDYHALHHENGAFNPLPCGEGGTWTWRPYEGGLAFTACTNGDHTHDPVWYRGFLYAAERERGLDCTEDLASPGTLAWDLAAEEAVLVLRAGGEAPAGPVLDHVQDAMARERKRRQAFPTRLHRAADAYLVRRWAGRTVVAGYPWFTDWGRDTFIAMRGLCADRPDDARAILRAWADSLSQGMLPNRFPDGGEPEYNAVDSSLWFIVAAHAFGADRELADAVENIVSRYALGTRHGIRMDADGLLACGEPGTQLTWMDARVDGRPVTPRVGKPVEVQALWINALRLAGGQWADMARQAGDALIERFWREDAGCLFDVVDVDHEVGQDDPSFRPNQILAVGGLPFPLLGGERAARLVDAVEQRLLTPMGLRTLAPDEPGYRGRYGGDAAWRDGAYHQGTAWPWLLGPFVEAWLRVRDATAEAKTEARARFLRPLEAHLGEAGIGHVSEVADGDPPHAPGGCPFQAWSLGELLRIRRVLSVCD